MNYHVITGDSAHELAQFPDNHFHSIVCDPPYGIDFLGKAWDHNTGDRAVYEQCLRVLRPGGHILAFSAARTYHHLAMTLEQVGFEIRDQIMWIYGSGFPKSQNVGKMIDSQILTGGSHTRNQRKMTMGDDYTEAGHYTVFPTDTESELAKQSKDTKTKAIWTPQTELGEAYKGWGTNLKPAHEPICMARKPMPVSVARNVQQWGTGAINVDACRVASENRTIPVASDDQREDDTMFKLNPTTHHHREETTIGRFPANIIHDGSPEVVELFPSTEVKGKPPKTYSNKTGFREGYVNGVAPDKEIEHTIYNDGGSAARFFYCAKVNKTERNVGCEDIEPKLQEAAFFRPNHLEKATNGETGTPFGRFNPIANNHPTVKPVELMKYLIRLVTPPGGLVLDPFAGSGSTGMAAVELGHEFVGIEREANYADIARRRIEAWHRQCLGLDPELFTVA